MEQLDTLIFDAITKWEQHPHFNIKGLQIIKQKTIREKISKENKIINRVSGCKNFYFT